MCFFKSGGNVDPAGRGWGSDVGWGGGRVNRVPLVQSHGTPGSGPPDSCRCVEVGVGKLGERGTVCFPFFLRAAKVATCRSRVFRTYFLSGLQHNSQLGPNASCQKSLIETNCQRGPTRAPGAA